jgi:hypothetical protein
MSAQGSLIGMHLSKSGHQLETQFEEVDESPPHLRVVIENSVV